jgi:flagellar motor switch protein FliM
MRDENTTENVDLEGLLEEEEPSEASAAAGSSRDATVTSFDFSRPANISKQFEKNLNTLSESFAKAASLEFTSTLRANTGIAYQGVDVKTFGAYTSKQPDLICASILALPPLNGLSLLQVDTNLFYMMMLRLLGGAIEPVTVERKFTDIELNIGRMITKSFLKPLAEGASKLVDLEPEFIHLENNSKYLSAMAPGESVLLLKFEITIEESTGDLVLCIPLAGFEPVWHRFDPDENAEFRTRAEVRRDRLNLFEVVRGAGVDVNVQLGEVDTTFQSILEMQIGDVVPLHKSVSSPLVLTIQGKPMFKGLAGKLNQSRAIKLTEKLFEED